MGCVRENTEERQNVREEEEKLESWRKLRERKELENVERKS